MLLLLLVVVALEEDVVSLLGLRYAPCVLNVPDCWAFHAASDFAAARLLDDSTDLLESSKPLFRKLGHGALDRAQGHVVLWLPCKAPTSKPAGHCSALRCASEWFCKKVVTDQATCRVVQSCMTSLLSCRQLCCWCG